ncbi:hypothetical protein [Herbaspirillum frisingense]|uniref:hypothetical protein n=1 Tax=Herbaspirillum frisingense TaxID=92645 RepID=UPI001F336813|nr:hypothetical protein [Herbaspirillum frisingense]UIN20311.1 hypothetical protein LAZ82_17755 [Herbaspirillum frisingense]
MSDTKPPVERKKEKQEHVPPRGHPQQHQGYKPNQEQVGSEEKRERQPKNDTEGNRSQSQQKEDAKSHIKTVLKTTLHW